MPQQQSNLDVRLAPANLRKEWRHPVDIRGEFRFKGKRQPAHLIELSHSGATVLLEVAPPIGAQAELWIEDFGTVSVRTIHIGGRSCGLAFLKGAAYLEEFLDWAYQHWLVRERINSPNCHG